jgi:MOSC domain-containing protein YiiM
MHLVSVNVGKERAIENGKPSGTTGIYKQPAMEAVQIHTLGLEGDVISDKKNHGGPDQAVYVYTSDDYAWWEIELGRVLEPGTFGDNLTISGMESASLNIGDRLNVGEVVLEVTAARIPCVTLAARMADPTFVKRFRNAGRPGLYCRVIVPGRVRAGDLVSLTPYAGDTLSVLAVAELYYDRDAGPDVLQQALRAPLAIRARDALEARLAV